MLYFTLSHVVTPRWECKGRLEKLSKWQLHIKNIYINAGHNFAVKYYSINLCFADVAGQGELKPWSWSQLVQKAWLERDRVGGSI